MNGDVGMSNAHRDHSQDSLLCNLAFGIMTNRSHHPIGKAREPGAILSPHLRCYSAGSVAVHCIRGYRNTSRPVLLWSGWHFPGWTKCGPMATPNKRPV